MDEQDTRWAIDQLVAAGATFSFDPLAGGALVGRAGNWRLTIVHRRGYWEATPLVGHGMPVEQARALHYKPTPHRECLSWPTIAGDVVRTDGYAGGRFPDRTVRRYHIDTVAGLRIFVDYVNQPGMTEAVVAAPFWLGSDQVDAE